MGRHGRDDDDVEEEDKTKLWVMIMNEDVAKVILCRSCWGYEPSGTNERTDEDGIQAEWMRNGGYEPLTTVLIGWTDKLDG